MDHEQTPDLPTSSELAVIILLGGPLLVVLLAILLVVLSRVLRLL